MNVNNNILPDILFDNINHKTILLSIAQKVKGRRLEQNFTQQALAKRAGITLASYRRFETSGEISLKSLVKIAVAMDSTDEFVNLFTRKHYQRLDEVLAVKDAKTRKRGRKNE